MKEQINALIQKYEIELEGISDRQDRDDAVNEYFEGYAEGRAVELDSFIEDLKGLIGES